MSVCSSHPAAPSLLLYKWCRTLAVSLPAADETVNEKLCDCHERFDTKKTIKYQQPQIHLGVWSLGCGEVGLEHCNLALNFFAPRAKLHRVITSMGSAATCSSYRGDANSQFVTLPRAKKAGAYIH